MASIVLDESTTSLSLSGGNWSQNSNDRYFGGFTKWPEFAILDNIGPDTGKYGTLYFEFRGTGATFFGNTPPAQASQWFMVSIDGGTPYKTLYMDPAPQSSRQWYQTRTLPDGSHNITITHIAGTSVDFIVVTAGISTPLSDEKLIVDDNDASMIEYNGVWTQNANPYTCNDGPVTGLPYGNSTHQTGTPGASATFQFSGSSVALYGVFSWQIVGSLSVIYTIDGFPTTRTYFVTPTTPEFKSEIQQRPNFLFFSNNSLTPGNHTVTMAVESAVRLSFSLDYILYSPSFATLAAKPNITQTIPVSSTAPTLIPTLARDNSPPIGAIIGSVVGGIAVLLIALAFVWRKKRSNHNSASSPLLPRAPSFEPFTLPSSSAATTGKRLLNPWSMSQHKSSTLALTSFSYSSIPSSSGTARHLSTTQLDDEIDIGVGFQNRMQRLEELALELNQEIAAGGENASRIAELRGRIAELTRHNTETSGGGRRRNFEFGSVAPPAYEPGEN